MHEDNASTVDRTEQAIISDVVRRFECDATIPPALILSHVTGRLEPEAFEVYRPVGESLVGPMRDAVWYAVIEELCIRTVGRRPAS